MVIGGESRSEFAATPYLSPGNICPPGLPLETPLVYKARNMNISGPDLQSGGGLSFLENCEL